MPQQETESLSLRVARLELLVAASKIGSPLEPSSFFLALVSITAGAYCAFLGLGLPNHPYQWVAGGLLVFFAYQRDWFRLPRNPVFWCLSLLNCFAAASLAKLFIGSGRRFPFQWIRYPELTWNRVGMLPEPTMIWQGVSFSGQEVDLTSVQMFLIGALVFGRCLRLQGFTSLMAIGLLAASLPALVSFHWNWVFPAVALTGVAFYLQSREFGFPKFKHS